MLEIRTCRKKRRELGWAGQERLENYEISLYRKDVITRLSPLSPYQFSLKFR
jgi:hypothetical protein